MAVARAPLVYRAAPPSVIVRGASVVGVVIAFGVPVYRALPGNVSSAWTTATFALIIGCLVLGIAGRPRWFGIWAFAGYAAVGAGIVSSGTSGLSAAVTVMFQIFLMVGLAPFALRGLVRRDPKVLVWASAAFLITQTASAAAGIAQLYGANVLGWIQINDRSPGLAGHPNVLGVMAGIAILICVSQILIRARIRFLLIVILLVNVGGLITTGSLSSMSATVLGVIVLLYAHGYRLWRIIVAALISGVTIWAVLSIPLVSEVLRNPVDRFLQVTGQTRYVSTLDIREQTYDAAWAYIASNPLLGRGLAPENAAARDFGTVVHNIFLRAWYQGGILLAVAIGLILVATLVVFLQAAVARRHGLAVGIVVVMLSYALTSAFFEQPYYWLPVIAAWATLPVGPLAPHKRSQSPEPYGRYRPRRFPGAQAT